MQVCHRILDFTPLVESCSANHPVRNTGANKHVLDSTGLGVRAVKDSNISIFISRCIAQVVNFLHDEVGLVRFRIGDITNELLPRALIGPQVLSAPFWIMRDHRVGGRENRLCGAIVLLQQD